MLGIFAVFIVLYTIVGIFMAFYFTFNGKSEKGKMWAGSIFVVWIAFLLINYATTPSNKKNDSPHKATEQVETVPSSKVETIKDTSSSGNSEEKHEVKTYEVNGDPLIYASKVYSVWAKGLVDEKSIRAEFDQKIDITEQSKELTQYEAWYNIKNYNVKACCIVNIFDGAFSGASFYPVGAFSDTEKSKFNEYFVQLLGSDYKYNQYGAMIWTIRRGGVLYYISTENCGLNITKQ
ncbi:MAG: hypothetical protein WCV63_10100 [Negativicutes bacterium]|jgi:hypothetical protein